MSGNKNEEKEAVVEQNVLRDNYLKNAGKKDKNYYLMKIPFEKEVHKTEYIDKKLPSIYYSFEKRFDMTRAEQTFITVSDKSSKLAFDTFRKIRKEVEKDGKQET